MYQAATYGGGNSNAPAIVTKARHHTGTNLVEERVVVRRHRNKTAPGVVPGGVTE